MANTENTENKNTQAVEWTQNTPETGKVHDKPFGVKIIVYVEVGEEEKENHEIGIAELRGAKPFTKEIVENFINSDDFILIIKDGLKEEGKEIKTFWIYCNN